jgi:hypothetical protein
MANLRVTKPSTFATVKFTPGAAPGSPVEGEVYYDSTLEQAFVYSDVGSGDLAWTTLAKGGGTTKCYGGQYSSYSGYAVHTFNSSGMFTVVTATTLQILVVAGGGGGWFGGGGAGGVSVHSSYSASVGNFDIEVGAGGVRMNSITVGDAIGDASMGHDSRAFGITSQGGGPSGQHPRNGINGGSGGGGGHGQIGTPGGTGYQGHSGGAIGYGNNGGANQTGYPYCQGGGGGAGGAGQAGLNYQGGDGGGGVANLYKTGSNITYGGGGGSGGNGYNAGTGSGGGGGGGGGGADGTPHLGGGGGGGYTAGQPGQYSGVGGSGCVVIRYVI